MSGFLWSYGPEKDFEKLLKWFSYFDVKVIKTRISRVDICADTDEVKFVPSDKDGL